MSRLLAYRALSKYWRRASAVCRSSLAAKFVSTHSSVRVGTTLWVMAFRVTLNTASLPLRVMVLPSASVESP